jgi:hypothetical protein
MASEWFYTRDHTSYGPVSSVQLQALARSGQLSPTDVVWRQGMAKWTPARTMNELFPPAPTTAARTPKAAPAKARRPAPARCLLEVAGVLASPWRGWKGLQAALAALDR